MNSRDFAMVAVWSTLIIGLPAHSPAAVRGQSGQAPGDTLHVTELPGQSPDYARALREASRLERTRTPWLKHLFREDRGKGRWKLSGAETAFFAPTLPVSATGEALSDFRFIRLSLGRPPKAPRS